eukprot:CCRYP_014993-RA/>CCRYP_014993-RA protein AED:0.39 eAED:0.59 QI:0/0/0/1/0/0/2/0/63
MEATALLVESLVSSSQLNNEVHAECVCAAGNAAWKARIEDRRRGHITEEGAQGVKEAGEDDGG